MSSYQNLINNSFRNSRNEKNDCTVIAVAQACNVPYEIAHNALSKCGRRPGVGAAPSITIAALALLGFEYEVIKLGGKITTSRVGYRFNKGTYMVHTSGHIVCLKDGNVLDYTNGRKFRVKRVARVTKVSDAKINTKNVSNIPYTKPKLTFSDTQSEFNGLAKKHRISADWYNTDIIIQNDTFKIVGLSYRTQKNIFHVQNVHTNELFKCDINTVLDGYKKYAKHDTQKAFAESCTQYGLTMDDYKRTFVYKEKKFALIGCSRNMNSLPLKCEDLYGNEYNMPLKVLEY